MKVRGIVLATSLIIGVIGFVGFMANYPRSLWDYARAKYQSVVSANGSEKARTVEAFAMPQDRPHGAHVTPTHDGAYQIFSGAGNPATLICMGQEIVINNEGLAASFPATCKEQFLLRSETETKNQYGCVFSEERKETFIYKCGVVLSAPTSVPASHVPEPADKPKVTVTSSPTPNPSPATPGGTKKLSEY